MLNKTKYRLPSLAVIAIFGASLAGMPSMAFAQGADAPATPSGTSSGSATDSAAQKPLEKAEAHIRELHAKLKITAAQDPQWQDFVNAQRESAKQMSELIEKRDESESSMDAVADFKDYEQIVEAHADGLKKVVPAFEKLYDSLSDQQKKMADTLFRNAQGRKAS